jgi:hypothetical protein
VKLSIHEARAILKMPCQSWELDGLTVMALKRMGMVTVNVANIIDASDIVKAKARGTIQQQRSNSKGKRR